MGDASYANRGSKDARQAPPIADGHSTMPPPAQSPTASSPPPQLPGDVPNNAFISQFDITQSSANQQSSFNMNAMATALPHSGYNVPYGHGAQPQQVLYPGATSPMSTQSLQPHQYGIQGFSNPNPQYYPQQGPPIQQYYPMPMYHTHPPPESLPARPTLIYAPGNVPSNVPTYVPHAPAAFHYYPTASFPAPARNQIRTSNQPALATRNPIDPRTAPPPIVTGSSGRGVGYVDGRSLRPNARTEESGFVEVNQGVVRGPPRKPKQRG